MSSKTLFNSALRQSTSIRNDLDKFRDAPSTALQGTITASLTSFSRTVDEYHNLSKAELVQEKQEKGKERVKKFREEIAEYRATFEQLKRESEERQTTQARAELFGRRPHHTATPENPYSDAALQQQAYSSPFGPPSSNPNPVNTYASPDYTREAHTFRERNALAGANATIDEFLDRGRDILGNLGDQREMLKGTQRRLYSVANTLGISGDTIRMVERRARQDKWIFWAGVVVFFLFCWLVLRYLR